MARGRVLKPHYRPTKGLISLEETEMQFARHSTLLTTAALVFVAGPLAAQEPETSSLLRPMEEQPSKNVQRESHAVHDIDGTLTGFGFGYKATFEPGRMEFLPALGKEAPRNFPLSFAFQSAGRGSTALESDGSAAPFEQDKLVTYQHGFMDERYEVTTDGIYQSFLFHEPLAGSGDLVVRGTLSTDLIPEALPDGSLLFHRGNGDGLNYGAVTGIDADGWTVQGSLRLDGNTLELVLPGSFVDAASFPLLLDPLLGSVTAVDDTAANDSSPEIANGSSEYLVVWERNFSLQHGEVYGQRLESDGDLEGGLIAISTGNGIISRQPAAGYVSAEQNYLVAYTYAPNFLTVPQIRARSVPFSGFQAVSASIAVSASGNTQSSPDVGGDQTGTDNEAFVVWSENGVGIRGRTISALDAAPVAIGSAFTIGANVGTNTNARPKVSKNIYTGTNFLVVYERLSGSRSFVRGRMYTRNGVALTGETGVYFNGFREHRRPDCDGDGNTFMVVWQRSEALNSPDNDIVCRPIYWDGSSMNMTSVEAIEEGAADNETEPDVVLTSSNAIVAYIDDNGALNKGYVKNVDPFTGLPAGLNNDPEQLLASTGSVTQVSIAGHQFSDNVMAAWDDTSGSNIFAQLYDGVGDSGSIGGGCGVEGRSVTPGALAGNSDFRIHLRDATPGVLAACVTGVSTLPIACGTCTLWPNVEVVYYDTTDGFGNASVNIPLPSNYADVTFYSQWVTFVPAGACPLAPLDFTDATVTTIDGAP